MSDVNNGSGGGSGSSALVEATYLYAADGTKLRVRGRAGKGFDYLGSVTLERGANSSLSNVEAIFAGGQFKVSVNGSGSGSGSGSGEVMYFDTDHLGSVRAVINNEGELLATNDYYPFGLRHNGGLLDDNIRYKFNGMEEQIIGDLDLLDYNARMYDPIVARWFVHDKLAEKYFKISPYVYCANNPLKFIDPTGMEIEDRVFNAAVGSGIGSFDVISGSLDIGGGASGGGNAGGETNSGAQDATAEATRYVNQKGELLHETNDGLDYVIVVPEANVDKLEDKLNETNANGTINDPYVNKEEMHTLGKTSFDYSKEKTDGMDSYWVMGYETTYPKAYEKGKSTFSLGEFIPSLLAAFGQANGDSSSTMYLGGRSAGLMDGNFDRKNGRINRLDPRLSLKNNPPLIKLNNK